MPVNIGYSEIPKRITNALLYQLSYPGVFRISSLAVLCCIIRSKCSGICACF
jgi:hypothetical protein